ncbi:hypothetical protein AAHE18_08G174400 [Arachis hypogaea]
MEKKLKLKTNKHGPSKKVPNFIQIDQNYQPPIRVTRQTDRYSYQKEAAREKEEREKEKCTSFSPWKRIFCFSLGQPQNRTTQTKKVSSSIETHTHWFWFSTAS